MLAKSGLFLCLLFVLQVSGFYKNVVQNPEFFENIIGNQQSRNPESSASRIVSGWEAQPGQHPHHANLRLFNQAGSIRHCGGSVVSRNWIITGAFCTLNRITAVIRAGVVNLNNPEYISESTELYSHRNYNQINFRHDIGLVKLQQPVVYTNNLKAIRVQSRRDAYANYNGLLVHTSGHGMTWNSGSSSEVLRWVYLRAMSNFNCQWQWYFFAVFETTICARSYNVSSQGICSGDNGGPLVRVGNDGIPTLIGVASFWGGNGCHTNAPSGFTRTGPYHAWFEQVTGINFETLVEEEETTTSTTTSTTSTSTTSTSTTSTTTTSTSTTSTTTSTPYEPPPPTPTSTTTESGDQEDDTEEPDDSDSNISTTTSTTTTPFEPPPPTPTSTTTESGDQEDDTEEPDDSDSNISTTTSTTTTPFEPSSPTPISTITESGDQEDDTEEPDDSDSNISTTTSTTTTPFEPPPPTPISTTTESGDEEDDTEEPDDSDESDDSSSEYEEVKPRPEDSEENEEEGSDADEDDELGQLLKRLEVIVKVKVKLSKSQIKKELAKAKHHLD